LVPLLLAGPGLPPERAARIQRMRIALRCTPVVEVQVAQCHHMIPITPPSPGASCEPGIRHRGHDAPVATDDNDHFEL
jgi:hypothetical protein